MSKLENCIMVGTYPRSVNPPSRSDTAALRARRALETRRLRSARYVQRVCNFESPRVRFELINRLADELYIEIEIDRLLDRFAGADIEKLRAIGCDQLPHPPIHEVRR